MATRRFRWMSTLTVAWSLQPGVADRAPEAFRALWQEAQMRWGDELIFPHARENARGLAYTRAAGDELPTPLELIDGPVGDAVLDAIRREHPDAGEVNARWSMMDHGVVLLEGQLALEAGATPEEVARAEQRVQQIGEAISTRVHRDVANDMLDQLALLPGAKSILVHDSAPESRPRWVARALVLDVDDAEQVGFAREWLRGTDDASDGLVDELLSRHRVNVTRWLNYVYRCDVDYEVQWTALRRAQYLYAAMFDVDTRLREILAWSMADPSDLSLSALKMQLQAAVDRAQALLLLTAEIGKFASRNGRSELVGILNRWDYAQVLEEPVRTKLALCQSRLDALAAERSARSSVLTDVILLCIGVTSLLSTALALVQFGRAAGADPEQSRYDMGFGSITQWLSSQPIDTVVILSTVFSLLLVAAFVAVRRRSMS